MIKARGFLFVGDIHLSSRKPGTRKDEYFGNTVLNKVEQVVDIANKEDLVIIFEGDIFDTPKETDESLKTRLTRILKKAKHLSFTNVGNHDKSGDKLSDNDTLGMMAEYEYPLKVIRESGPVGIFELNGIKIGLGMTPYGQEIPKDVTHMFKDVESVVWITHHDLAFEGHYPGAMETFEIKGCSLVSNGHMHLEKKPIQQGDTLWINHGSLVRTAKDAAYHAPFVTGIIPGEGDFVRYNIIHDNNIFNMAGKMVEASPGENVSDEHVESVFVSLLASTQSNINPLATDNGEVLMEALNEKFQENKTDNKVKNYILNTFQKIKNEE